MRSGEVLINAEIGEVEFRQKPHVRFGDKSGASGLGMAKTLYSLIACGLRI
jgi:hypothetical protein